MLKFPFSVTRQDLVIIAAFVITMVCIHALLRNTTSISEERIIELLERQSCDYYSEAVEYYYFEDGNLEKGNYEGRSFNSYEAALNDAQRMMRDYDLCSETSPDTVKIFVVSDCDVSFDREEIAVIFCSER